MKVNRNQLAGILGLSVITVDGYVRRGLPCERPGARGRAYVFETATVVEWLRQKDVEDAIGDISKLDFLEARRRHMAAQAGLQEYELARVRRDMIGIAEVEEIVSEEYGAVRSRLLAVPGLAATLCEGKSASEIEGILRDEIADALTELTAADAPEINQEPVNGG